MLAEFLAHYDANIATESRPFPGAVASLETLKARGATLAVCTNKRDYLARKLLAALVSTATLKPSPAATASPWPSRIRATSPRPSPPRVARLPAP